MRPIVTFYKTLVYPASFFTLFTCFLLVAWGSVYYVLTLLWIKIFSSALIGTASHFTRAEHLYFYHNLGYSTIWLYAMTAALDLLVWACVVALTVVVL